MVEKLEKGFFFSNISSTIRLPFLLWKEYRYNIYCIYSTSQCIVGLFVFKKIYRFLKKRTETCCGHCGAHQIWISFMIICTLSFLADELTLREQRKVSSIEVFLRGCPSFLSMHGFNIFTTIGIESSTYLSELYMCSMCYCICRRSPNSKGAIVQNDCHK